MNGFETEVMEARVSLELWTDAVRQTADDDEGWAWIVNDMTAHVFDELPMTALLVAIGEGEDQ